MITEIEITCRNVIMMQFTAMIMKVIMTYDY